MLLFKPASWVNQMAARCPGCACSPRASVKRYRFSTPPHEMRRLGFGFSLHKRPIILQLWLRDCRSEQRPHIWRVRKHRHGITFTRPAANTDCQALVIPGDPVQRMQLSLGQRLTGSESKPAYIKSTQVQPLLPPRGEPRSLISNISRAYCTSRPRYFPSGGDEPHRRTNPRSHLRNPPLLTCRA